MRVHCCLLDRQCLWYARRHGSPLRLHVGGRSWTILANNRRSKRIWDQAWAEGNVYQRDSATGKLTNIRGEESPLHLPFNEEEE